MEIEPSKIGLQPKEVTVSCLMLTLAIPERLAFAKKSIENFCRQTLEKKELVLVINGGTESGRKILRDYVETLGRKDILISMPPSGLNLGELRNYSLTAATGDVLCQWDDDDLFHPERLEKQLSFLVEGNFDAVYLQEVMQFFPSSKMMYWTNWRATQAIGHPGTLMLRRGVTVQYPTHGDTAHLGEDTHVALSLGARGKVGYLTGMPHLFVYVSHGANSWDDGHHRMLADKLSISQALMRRREAQIREGLAPHGFSPGTISMLGNNGTAFTL